MRFLPSPQKSHLIDNRRLFLYKQSKNTKIIEKSTIHVPKTGTPLIGMVAKRHKISRSDTSIFAPTFFFTLLLSVSKVREGWVWIEIGQKDRGA